MKELKNLGFMRSTAYCSSDAGPPILKPQLLSVGAFSCLFAPVPACCWGFLRKPADFASRPNWPFRATFHSLLAIPRSDLAPWNWPEVRKGRNAGPYRSKGYARTNQAVGLQHWLPEWANVPAQSQQSYRALYSICSNSFCAASLAAASCAGASGSRSTPARPAT